jgi:hypothetical protein
MAINDWTNKAILPVVMVDLEPPHHLPGYGHPPG